MSKLEEQAEKFKALLTVLNRFKKRNGEVQELVAEIHRRGALAGSLRIKVINALESLYKPSERMTSFQKIHARVIISLKQGFDGDIAECFYCGETGEVLKGMQNHHEDYRTWNNVLSNLHAAHPKCNTTHSNDKKVRQKVAAERVAPAQKDVEHETQWTSAEGERHDRVRVRFDKHILDVVNGPFAVDKKKRQENPGDRAVWPLRRLARYCVNVPELRDGNIKVSSVTFTRWIMEDTEGPDAPLWIDTEEKPYKIGLKETVYRRQCRLKKIPEAEYLTGEMDDLWK